MSGDVAHTKGLGFTGVSSFHPEEIYFSEQQPFEAIPCVGGRPHEAQARGRSNS